MSSTIKIGRNDVCFCGSGKKFKKCCLGKPAPKKETSFVNSRGGLVEFDGHFWVEKDGVVIDPNFSHYLSVKILNDCEGDRIYLPAPAECEKVWVDALINEYTKQFGSLEAFKEMMEKYKIPIRAGACEKNALMNYIINGGTIRFGSLGWKIKNSDKIWWEYGGEDWTNAEDFVKENAVQKSKHLYDDKARVERVMGRLQRGEVSIEDIINGCGGLGDKIIIG